MVYVEEASYHAKQGGSIYISIKVFYQFTIYTIVSGEEGVSTILTFYDRTIDMGWHEKWIGSSITSTSYGKIFYLYQYYVEPFKVGFWQWILVILDSVLTCHHAYCMGVWVEALPDLHGPDHMDGAFLRGPVIGFFDSLGSTITNPELLTGGYQRRSQDLGVYILPKGAGKIFLMIKSPRDV